MSLEREFELFLDREWPLWRQHKGNVKWHNMRTAFFAGFKIGDEGPSREVVAEIVPDQVSIFEAITSPPRDFKPPKMKRR